MERFRLTEEDTSSIHYNQGTLPCLLRLWVSAGPGLMQGP